MTSTTTQLVPIGALRTDSPTAIVFRHVYCIPVWRDNEIAWYDQYTLEGGYLGKTKILQYLKEAHDYVSRYGNSRKRL